MNTNGSNGHRAAKGGTLVLGGGFGGAYVARLLGKRGAAIVSLDSSMLYTPLLPEVAAGAFVCACAGSLGALVTRSYHLHQLPLFSRRIRVLADGMLSRMFRRDMTEMGLTEAPRPSRP